MCFSTHIQHVMTHMSVYVNYREKFSLLESEWTCVDLRHYCSLTPALQKVCSTAVNSFISHRVWTASTFGCILLWSYHIHYMNGSPKYENSVFHSHAVPNLSAMEHERRSLARGSFPNNERKKVIIEVVHGKLCVRYSY